MRASEAIRYLQDCVRTNRDGELVIHRREPSIGPSATTSVSGIFQGIDWDTGKIIIELANPLVSDGHDRDTPIQATHGINLDGKRSRGFVCPKCDARVEKRFRYCPSCGQRIAFDEISK